MLKYTYIHDPLFGPPASWMQPETSIGRHCHCAKVTVGTSGLVKAVTCWYCCGVHCGNYDYICVILYILTCLPLIKTFCILLIKLNGRGYIIFTSYIVSVFPACFYNACACDRFWAWSYSLKRVYNITPDSLRLECIIGRLSTLDTVQKTGVWKWVVI